MFSLTFYQKGYSHKPHKNVKSSDSTPPNILVRSFLK